MPSYSVTGTVYCANYPDCTRAARKGFLKCKDCLAHSVNEACNPHYDGWYSLEARKARERRGTIDETASG